MSERSSQTFLEAEDVLCQESRAIHGVALDGSVPLPRALCQLKSAALCLSGGGIRSAAFCLGVVQALATYPRGGKANASLLAQFHYLSTVSGGGYIGSWLSAWRSRNPFSEIRNRLVNPTEGKDVEAKEIEWLRSLSNYLTPKVGLFSLDTWTAATLWVRNLLLNWLVIIPPVISGVVLIKILGLLSVWIILWAKGDDWAPTWDGTEYVFYLKLALEIALGLAGFCCLVLAIAFQARYRPSVRVEGDVGPNAEQFFRRFVVLSLLAAVFLVHFLASDLAGNLLLDCAGRPASPFFFSLCPASELAKVVSTGLNNARYPLSYFIAGGVGLGAVAYMCGWLFGGRQNRKGEWAAWATAGASYGALLAFGFYVYLIVPDSGVTVAGEIVLPVYFLHLVFLVPWLLFSQLIADTIFVGLSSYGPNSDPDREWLGRASGWLLMILLTWLVLNFLVYFGAIAGFFLSAQVQERLPKVAPLVATISGIITALFGTSNATPAAGRPKSPLARVIAIVVPIFAVLFAFALLIALSLAVDHVLFNDSMINKPPEYLPQFAWGSRFVWLLIGFTLSICVAAISSTFVNINRFSLHAIYRNRLVSAFLGASRVREPDLFTGLDPHDNPLMKTLWNVKPGDWQPFHILNLTLNLVSTNKLAWQERKAEPFTVSPLHSGNSRLGYRNSAEYGGPDGITLGTAMAISGAAASPNMGYHSSPAITFLLTLFNVRLGWWLGNPGPRGEKTYRTEGPKFAVWPLFKEAAGRTTDESRYVYLSDGGHFENLGIYEMVRRRCRHIVAVDAGCDPYYTLEDLANASRKIEIDLGIKIKFSKLSLLKPRPKDGTAIGPNQPYCALGEVDYKSSDPNCENGKILYIKAGYHGVEPPGVVGYANSNPDFPHQSTINQWFTESQFESYRALGYEIASGIIEPAAKTKGPLTLKKLFASVESAGK